MPAGREEGQEVEGIEEEEGGRDREGGRKGT